MCLQSGLSEQEFPDYKVLAVRCIQMFWRKRQAAHGSRAAPHPKDDRRTKNHDKGQKSAISGPPSPLEALHWISCFFSSIYVQFSKTSPLKSGESSEKSSGENRVKSCHVCGCHGFFGPDTRSKFTTRSIFSTAVVRTLTLRA